MSPRTATARGRGGSSSNRPATTTSGIKRGATSNSNTSSPQLSFAGAGAFGLMLLGNYLKV